MTLPKEDKKRSPLLESVIKQTTQAVLITEGRLEKPGPQIIYVNAAFTEITGYEPHEVVGKTPRILQGPETEPWVLDQLRKRLKQGLSFEGEAINYRKDGSPYVNHWSIAPVHNEAGTITHWVSVQRDVTERRRMNERLMQVQEKERQRLAERMHDQLGGLLTSLQMEIDQARTRVDDATLANDLFGPLEEQIDSISHVVRNLTQEESPHLLEDYGLSEALSRLVGALEEREGLEIAFHNELGNDERLSSLLERVVYRVLREGLLNVAHHAQTDSAQVILNKTNRKLRLHIIDHGTGFDTTEQLSDDENYGLAGIRERVEQLNGSFTISTAPGVGTRLTITLPLSLVALPTSSE